EPMILLAYRASVHRDHKPAEALAWAEQAATLAQRYPEKSRARAYTAGMHAITLRTNKRFAEAETAAADSIWRTARPGRDPEWRLWWAGEMHELLGRVYFDQGRFADARREYTLGLARRETLFGESGPRTIEAYAALGFNEQAAGDVAA